MQTGSPWRTGFCVFGRGGAEAAKAWTPFSPRHVLGVVPCNSLAVVVGICDGFEVRVSSPLPKGAFVTSPARLLWVPPAAEAEAHRQRTVE